MGMIYNKNENNFHFLTKTFFNWIKIHDFAVSFFWVSLINNVSKVNFVNSIGFWDTCQIIHSNDDIVEG